MRKLGLILVLLTAALLWAQQGTESKPNGAEHNTPGSRQGAGNFSQSTIQGCAFGSAVTSHYVLTDENTGEIYLLRGNERLLKEQVGHEVVMTGTAVPIRPSDKKGTVGYISPNAPSTRGTSNRGGKALGFEVTLIKPIADQCRQETESQKEAVAASQAALGSVQGENNAATEPRIGYAAQSQTQNTLIGCVSGSTDHRLLVQEKEHRTYRLQGDAAAVENEVGKIVKITGQLMPGAGRSASGAAEAAPAFQVTRVERIKDSCQYSLAPGQTPTPATGKTGGEGEALNASSSASAGRVTPGMETEAGRAQAPGSHTQLNAGGAPQPQNQTAGAPPNWEQAAQNPADAETMAQGAQRAELDDAQHQLGVNAKPDYSQNRNTEKHTELPGASQHPSAPSGARQKKEQEAAEHQETHPTLVGCLKQGSNEHEFMLTEQRSGRQYRLKGSPEELKVHVNHLVELVGKPTEEKAAPRAVAGGAEAGFEVSGMQDLAPTCGAGRR